MRKVVVVPDKRYYPPVTDQPLRETAVELRPVTELKPLPAQQPSILKREASEIEVDA